MSASRSPPALRTPPPSTMRAGSRTATMDGEPESDALAEQLEELVARSQVS